jgi:hypothetical protein
MRNASAGGECDCGCKRKRRQLSHQHGVSSSCTSTVLLSLGLYLLYLDFESTTLPSISRTVWCVSAWMLSPTGLTFQSVRTRRSTIRSEKKRQTHDWCSRANLKGDKSKCNIVTRTTCLGAKRIDGISVDSAEDVQGEEEIDFDSISDDQVLLACRAYLARTHRLEWTERAKRREHAAMNTRQPSATHENSKNGNSYPSISGSIFDTNNAAVGYFWEDPSELIYLGKDKVIRQALAKLENESNVDVDDTNNDDTLSNEDDYDDTDDYDFLEEEEEDYDQEEEEDTELLDFLGKNAGTGAVSLKPPTALSGSPGVSVMGEEFTSFPLTPDARHENKSSSLRSRFADPQWKAEWYSKRWGSGRTLTLSEKRDKRLAAKLSKMPSFVLRSKELEDMTDDELTEAVQTYIQSNNRKAKAQHERRLQKEQGQVILRNEPQIQIEQSTKDDDDDDNNANQHQQTSATNSANVVTEPILARQQLSFSFESSNPDTEAQLEAQRKRSEAAKQRYKVRQENRQKTTGKDPTLSRNYVTATTINTFKKQPTASQMNSDVSKAMRRVQKALKEKNSTEKNKGVLRMAKPLSCEDIVCILKPSRLPGRRKLLTDILSIRFDCHGKCIPRGEDSGETLLSSEKRLMFVQHATIRELGEHILRLLEH